MCTALDGTQRRSRSEREIAVQDMRQYTMGIHAQVPSARQRGAILPEKQFARSNCACRWLCEAQPKAPGPIIAMPCDIP